MNHLDRSVQNKLNELKGRQLRTLKVDRYHDDKGYIWDRMVLTFGDGYKLEVKTLNDKCEHTTFSFRF